MKSDTYARFALSGHKMHTHFSGGGNFCADKIEGYTPQLLRMAYSWTGEFDGRGVKIAVISALDNTAVSQNLAVFCEAFGLPTAKIDIHYPLGRATGTSRAWLTEASLDTQWAHAFAPQAALDIVFSPDASVSSLLSCAQFASAELYADVVCMCFGSDESGADRELCEFMKESKSVFVSSSGDIGGRVSFPSTSPDCISIGGTSLFASSQGARVSENAWKNGGGGASEVFDVPSYQARFADVARKTRAMRGTPDASFSADYSPGAAVYVSSLGGWSTIGGTSLAAACFAGICACIRQAYPEIKSGADMLSFLYERAGGDVYELPQYNYHDIVLGRSGDFFAEKGWDFCTGLGSPVIGRLLM